LWSQRAVLADKDVVIAWGMKDIAFREKELNRWVSAFPRARVLRFPDVGHYVSEEVPQEVAAAIVAAEAGTSRQGREVGPSALSR
jgi:haloalkane dehalogenase